MKMSQPPPQVSARRSVDRLALPTPSAHPMKTGRHKDATGQLIAAHFIARFVVTLNRSTVMDVDSGPGSSANPALGFRRAGVKTGDPIAVAWQDHLGQRASHAVTVSSVCLFNSATVRRCACSSPFVHIQMRNSLFPFFQQ